MIVPLTTDAPIYHRPYGTVGLILLNVLLFTVTAGSPEVLSRYGLVHGHGPVPLQWVTSNFLHGNWLHLAGNMLFLWGFGLVIEGKIGWQRFVPLYLGMGAVESALEQALFSTPGTVSCGASAVIFGLMAMALIWVPRNELTLGYWFFFLMGTVEMSILSFSALALLMSISMLWFAPGTTPEMLHLLGAGVGMLVGFGMLRLKLVDCEGWDLLSVLTGRTPDAGDAYPFEHQQDLQRRQSRRRARRKADRVPSAMMSVPPAERLSTLIRAGKPLAALAELQRIRHLRPGWVPVSHQILDLARELRSVQQWSASIEMYEMFLTQEPDAALARLELAELFVLVQERPCAARKLVDSCESSSFTASQKARLERVYDIARQMLDSGIIEIQGQL